MQQQQNQANIIQNPKMSNEQAGPQMNDRDRLNDCLSSDKWLTDNFNIMARECSHRELYNDCITILTETHQCCRDIFNHMFEMGHYKLETAEAQKIQQSQQQFQQYAQTQFPTGQMQ